jgi:hypothetical protein
MLEIGEYRTLLKPHEVFAPTVVKWN